ncbi:integrator complex subunit 12-like [Melanaphis sacchari]|uniref:integrator complex subunit 12-like n=1 Tax=Melanaphis sacchari TaxID=742174 RepID=UPI000DC13ED0|nr:integrator complex subunit 12-like [Melanaphis sacchari]
METSVELEPFMKTGFKLLRRTKDSNSIKLLFKHFEDSIQESYGSNRRPTNAAKKLSIPTALLSKDLGIEQVDLDDESSSSSSSSSPIATTSKSIIEVSSSPPPTITLEQAKSDPVINIDSDSESETEKVEPYSCCTCKESYVVMGNSLVECLECHSMYHQNCHNPPIIDINLNDPRIVWYCINCRQKDSQKTESRSSGKESKKSSSKNASGSKAEKLSSSKTSQGTKSSSSKSKSSSANSSPKQYPPTSSTMMSVMEKRVQMMKKKAAKKTEKKK